MSSTKLFSQSKSHSHIKNDTWPDLHLRCQLVIDDFQSGCDGWFKRHGEDWQRNKYAIFFISLGLYLVVGIN